MIARKYYFIGLIVSLISTTVNQSCSRIPENKMKVYTNKYVIEISGNPQSYTPLENYTITLTSVSSALNENRFREFTLVAEPKYPLPGRFAGNFLLIDKLLTTFDPKCHLTVIQTNPTAKTSVDVVWQAPPVNSGCVIIQAAVSEFGETWFADGELTKELCEENEENEDRLPRILRTCCACNEAKYEVAFEGLWSRNTHPKGFPEDMWKTKLGDIIGASHKYGRSFWEQGRLASEGLRLLAEEGNTSLLESELKAMVKNDDIRTIIKARELAHPKITGTSYTVLRVDSDNHLISLVSKITPSPDWIVGVSNLDLCLENCSWAMSYTFNLYPWDVGTDSGLSYDSVDVLTAPPQLIRPIKSNSPNRDESPFYDPEGKPIKPLAKLHLTRQKLYEKCNSNNFGTSEIRCEVGEWGEWSSCSVTCGTGVRTRDRALTFPHLCPDSDSMELQETEECDTEAECDGDFQQEDDCSNTEWGKWSPCSVTCGNGTKERYRIPISEDNEDEDDENNIQEEHETCRKIHQTVECYTPPCPFGELETDGQLIDSGPDGPVVDCKVSRWSIWSPCNTTVPCKKRYTYRVRHILTHAQNGGKACPRKLQKKRKCTCTKDEPFGISDTPRTPLSEEDVDCVLGPWSQWSPCSTTCGHAVRQRIRSILIRPSGRGKPCETRIQEKKCPLPLACTGRGISSYYR